MARFNHPGATGSLLLQPVLVQPRHPEERDRTPSRHRPGSRPRFGQVIWIWRRRRLAPVSTVSKAPRRFPENI